MLVALFRKNCNKIGFNWKQLQVGLRSKKLFNVILFEEIYNFAKGCSVGILWQNEHLAIFR